MITRLSFVLYVLVVLCAFPCSASASEYHVGVNGSDSWPGSAVQPFLTIGKGIQLASNPGDLVTIHPGIYHEGLRVTAKGASGQPITIRAAERGATIVDGSERVQGWSLVDAVHNVWEVYVDSEAPYNNADGRWDMPPRSEQVYVNGERCEQLKEDVSLDAMTTLSFTATLTSPSRYLLKPPFGVDPNGEDVEVSLKGELLRLDYTSANITVDGLVFRRARDTYQQAMVVLFGDSHEISNCVFEDSSAGSGMSIGSRGSLIRDCSFLDNGQFGFAMGGSGNTLYNNLVQGNDLAGYRAWATGGTKIVGCANVLRRNRFIGNLGGVAIWLDVGPCDNVIERNYVSNNHGEGIRAEISYHSYIGYNIVEETKPATSFMFGETKTNCIGISVQNSAETIVCNNLVKDTEGPGIQIFAYNRSSDDLPDWQHCSMPQEEWIARSREAGVVYANDNQIVNNILFQSIPGVTEPCMWWRGPLNGERVQIFGNKIDCNYYWNPVTQLPQVKVQDLAGLPGPKGDWQSVYGFDMNGGAALSAADYSSPLLDDEYPYAPAKAQVQDSGCTVPVSGFPGHEAVDYLGRPVPSEAPVGLGPIQYITDNAARVVPQLWGLFQ